MRKHLVAALVAALMVAGVASADYIRRLESYQITTKVLVVGDNTTPPLGNGELGSVPATETIVAAATITADACGGIKNVTAAGAVTTGTTNTFTAPAQANKGCIMQVCNTGANAITLDDNANFFGAGIAGATPGDTVLGADDCCPVGSDGSAWRQLAACAQG